MKACPHCRLPITRPGMTFHASEDDTHFVFLICEACAERLDKLPKSTRFKALNSASGNVVNDPDRYAHRAFTDYDDANLFCRLAGDPATVLGVVAELMS